MTQKIFILVCLVATLMLTTLVISNASASDADQTFDVSTSKSIKDHGVTARSASMVKKMEPTLPEVTVQMEVTKPITEVVRLRALNEDGKEILHSNTVRIIAQKTGSHPLTFAFPQGTVLTHVKTLELVGPIEISLAHPDEELVAERVDVFD